LIVLYTEHTVHEHYFLFVYLFFFWGGEEEEEGGHDTGASLLSLINFCLKIK